MTTEHAKEVEVGTCYFCGGPRQENKTMVPFVVSEQVVIVKEVPAEVCAQCGEAYLTTGVTEILTSAVREIADRNVELTIVNYSDLAPVAVDV